jgi:RNA-directed DNA polymerase
MLNEKLGATSWETISWVQVNASVKHLRGLIFTASKKGDIKLVRRLQELMLRSRTNTLLSIRRVTSINVGKRTPGLDQMLIKTNEERWNIYLSLINMDRSEWLNIAKPVRRVYIPKPNGRFRPLGIPTVRDRIIQNIVKNALEPEWESKFESSSYGFRPKRSCHDALARLWVGTARQKKRLWVLDADIKGCFDNINHEKLLDLIGDFPGSEIIKVWLKAGYCLFPEDEVVPTLTGTPQGGVISPLLANIALHGIEKSLGIKTVSTTGHNYGSNKYNYIRYADDFIVLCRTKEDCAEALAILTDWLASRGLVFAPEKVNIRHLSEGIKFLGCLVRLYGHRDPTVLITPHPEKVKAFKERLKEIWLKHCSHDAKVLISELNPIIRGWANYYAPFSSKTVFSALDHYMWLRAWRYAKRRHPMKNAAWRFKKYFSTAPGTSDKWSFHGCLTKGVKMFLCKFSRTKIIRHVMVKNNMLPDDPKSTAYWELRDSRKVSRRWGNYESRIRISNKQFHICPVCNGSLYSEAEELHLHHIVAVKDGGTDSYPNLVLLHSICHRQLHSLKIGPVEMKRTISLLRKRMIKKLKYLGLNVEVAVKHPPVDMDSI